MERLKKYSTRPSLKNMICLMAEDIPFMCCKGLETGKKRFFFMAREEEARMIAEVTGWIMRDESGSGEFDRWHVLEH